MMRHQVAQTALSSRMRGLPDGSVLFEVMIPPFSRKQGYVAGYTLPGTITFILLVPTSIVAGSFAMNSPSA